MAERRAAVVGLSLALSLAHAGALGAQNADSLQTLRAGDALTRIRRYTSSDVSMARAIADSLVRALPADASVMPEALFAKASIASSAADAEQDYSRIVNEYRFASKVPDALMRLALLEGARNNRAGALRHLDRLLRDHSEGAVRSRASLMAGRLRLEMNDPARGCELLAAAWASAGLTERDVKDQAESLGAKCPVPVAERARREPSPLGILRAPSDSPTRTVAVSPAPTAASRRRERDSVAAVQAARATARRDSLAKVAAAAKEAAAARAAVAVAAPSAPVVVRQSAPVVAARRDSAPPRAVPTVTRRDTSPTPVVAARTAPVSTPPVVTTPPTLTPAPPVVARDASPATTAAGIRYAVQFAAYNDRPGAEQFAESLRRGGVPARVEGTARPFRVRAGRFTTRAEAEATLQLWKKPGQQAIVVSYP